MCRLRIGRVGQALELSASTLLRWERDHRVRFHRTPGDQRYLTEDEFRALRRITTIPQGSRRKKRPAPPRYWWRGREEG